MNNFIETARTLREGNTLTPDKKSAFDLVFEARTKLQAVFSKAHLDIDNIESLFGAFEMAELLGHLTGLADDKLGKVRDAVIELIATTLEESVLYPVNGNIESRSVNPPSSYASFADLLQKLNRNRQNWSDISILTFNYDVAVDFALYNFGIPVNYCLGPFKGEPGVDLLKLHGSLNWGQCSGCKQVIPFTMREYFNRYSFMTLIDVSKVKIHFVDKLPSVNCDPCHTSLPSKAVIAPPTWNKGKYHEQLKSVWRQAAKRLAEAENIFIIGYSFPKTDEFFRHFYALGSIGEAIPNLVWLVNPSAEVDERIRDIFGRLVLSPHRYSHLKTTFSNSLPLISERLLK